MKNIFTKLFKKPEKEERVPADGFKTSLDEAPTFPIPTPKKDIIVKTDVAFHKPASKVIEEIKSKFKNEDYASLEFEEDIEDFNLKALSPQAKQLIIQIIKEDNKHRESKILSPTNEGISYSPTKFPIVATGNPNQYGINPETKQIGIMADDTAGKLVSFKEFWKKEEEKQIKELEKNREEVLYKTTSEQFPEYTHEQIIEFLKKHFKIDASKD